MAGIPCSIWRNAPGFLSRQSARLRTRSSPPTFWSRYRSALTIEQGCEQSSGVRNEPERGDCFGRGSMARLVQPPPPETFPEKCRFAVADLTDSDAVERVSAEISSRSRLDVLVLRSGT